MEADDGIEAGGHRPVPFSGRTLRRCHQRYEEEKETTSVTFNSILISAFSFSFQINVYYNSIVVYCKYLNYYHVNNKNCFSMTPWSV